MIQAKTPRAVGACALLVLTICLVSLTIKDVSGRSGDVWIFLYLIGALIAASASFIVALPIVALTPPREPEEMFRTRADMLNVQAWMILFLIVVLFAAGAFAFYKAPAITRADRMSPKLNDKLNTFRAQSESEEKVSNSLSDKRNAREQKIVSDISNTYQIDFGRTNYNPGGTCDPNGKIEVLQTITPNIPFPQDFSFSASIEKALSEWSVSSAGKRPIKLQISYPGSPVLCATPDQIMSLGVKMDDLLRSYHKDIATIADAQKTSNNKMRVLTIAIDELERKSARLLEGDDLLQSEEEAQPTDKDVRYNFIQTSVTRFGALAIISFLVAILVPLYRYNMRLSAFYMARSDAMRLKSSGVLEASFVDLSAAITPPFDFGRSPRTPLEQVTDLAKAATGKGS